jgi:hypothetical protein
MKDKHGLCSVTGRAIVEEEKNFKEETNKNQAKQVSSKKSNHHEGDE